MTILPLASGSKGNCYLIKDGVASILIEAGIPQSVIKRKLWQCGLAISDLNACLISHEHGDHSRSVTDLLRYGVDVYMSPGTAKALSINHHRLNILVRQATEIGTWTIMSFPVVHDAMEPVGFLIKRGDNCILYATDTAYISNRFSGLTHIMIECNYDPECLDDAVANGNIDRKQRLRIMETHFGLENVLEMLRANDLSRVVEIWLLHLSERHIDPDYAREQVQEVTGVPVYVAR